MCLLSEYVLILYDGHWHCCFSANLCLPVCPTTLKRICRQHGIMRWPSRKIKKVGHSLKKLQGVIDSVRGAEGTFEFSSVYENFMKIPSLDKQLSRNKIHHPESCNTFQLEEHRFSAHTAASNSLSSTSRTQSSSSSLGYSSGLKQLIHAPQLVLKQEASGEENQATKLVRANSQAELQCSKQELPRHLFRSQSHKVLSEHPSLADPSQLQKMRSNMFKVKAIYGEEKVRVRLQPTWGIQELKQEIVKRFSITDTCSVDLKYLDDDSEWVLLTCDADLQECIDVYKSSGSGTIKLSVHRVAHSVPRASFSFPAMSWAIAISFFMNCI